MREHKSGITRVSEIAAGFAESFTKKDSEAETCRVIAEIDRLSDSLSPDNPFECKSLLLLETGKALLAEKNFQASRILLKFAADSLDYLIESGRDDLFNQAGADLLSTLSLLD